MDKLTWDEFCDMDDKDIFKAHNRLIAQLNRCRDEIKRAKRAADPVVIHLNNALTALEGRNNG